MEFRQALFQSGTKSVDAFLAEIAYKKPQYVDLGKLAIAYTIMRCEINENLFKHNIRNWYKDLWQLLWGSWEEFDGNKLQIITFNYDRSIEQFLFTSVKNLTGRSDEECAEKFSNTIGVIHVHGKLGHLLWEDPTNGISYKHDQSGDIIKKASQQIKIISEGIADDVEFRQAHSAIQKAQNIFFLGFGYNVTNLRHLQIKELSQNKAVAGTCQELTSRQRKLANEHGIKSNPTVSDINSFVKEYL